MAMFMLFCTAHISGKLIGDLLHQSQQTIAGHNCWSLVRNPNQHELETPTHVPVSNFQTGFEGASIDALGTWMTDRCSRMPEGWNPIEDRTFGVLDQRSARDETMLVVRWFTTWPQECIERCDPDPERKIEGWKTLRVKFGEASHAAIQLDEDPSLLFEEMSGVEYYEGDVYRVPYVQKLDQKDIEALPAP
ncbi:MAG: hypothetical protein M1833_006734 [Piccolia ochrophora]|nr:MAG: hypothetical protein M1833_006734 [Piccolia ochrophora]